MSVWYKHKTKPVVNIRYGKDSNFESDCWIIVQPCC